MNNFKRVSFWVLFLGLALVKASLAQAETLIDGDTCIEEHPAPIRTFVFNPGALSPNADFPFLTIKVGEVQNYSEKWKIQLERVLRVMETVINSEALKEKILAHTYDDKLQFADNNGKSNAEIYESIRRGLETTFGKEEFVAEFNHTLYYKRFTREVGRTTNGQPWIISNTKYYSPFNEAEAAGHLTHEWTHLLGYPHKSTFIGSVPYDVGYMVRDIAAQLLAQ
jgi:hypothetical protein